MSSATAEGQTQKEINEETESEGEQEQTTTCQETTGAAEATTTSFNPSVSDDEDNDGDLERIRGDAIGNTLYSERYVLSTLLKLTKLEEGEEQKNNPLSVDLEKDLCALWDMTIEEDVVLLLLEHKVLELFAQCIDETEDKRLTEILVGMMGNMCSVQSTRDALCGNTDVIATLLGLIGCSDALTLIQLMRLLSVVLVHADADAAESWFRHFCSASHFVSDLCFLLSNSVNETLLAQALEALNAILAKFALIVTPQQQSSSSDKQNGGADVVKMLSFSEIFVKEALISSTIEAFETLMPKQQQRKPAAVADDESARLPTQSARKTMQIFLNIHCILTQYDEESRACYAAQIPQVIDCLGRCLEPLCDPMCLLPLSNYDQEVVENVNDIFLVFGDPFDARCIGQMITIWNHIAEEMETRAQRSPAANEFEEEEDEPENSEICYEDFCLTILDFITRTVRQADEAALQQALRRHTPLTVLQLLDALSAGDSEADIKECCSKIKTAFESLNKVVKQA